METYSNCGSPDASARCGPLAWLSCLLLLATGCDRGAHMAADGVGTGAAARPESIAPTDAGPTSAWVTGTVFYRQRVALPPETIVTVRLVDVSRADAAAIVLAEKALATQGRQVPIPFELSYDAARIDPRFAYQIEARINHGDELLFISTESFPVITRGNPATIAVRVDQVR